MQQVVTPDNTIFLYLICWPLKSICQTMWKPDEENNGIPTKNLWLYKSNSGLWEAKPDNYTDVDYFGGTHENRLAYKTLDLSSFSPEPDMDCQVKLVPDSSKLALETGHGTSLSIYEVLFKNREGANLGDDTWIPLMTVQQFKELKNAGSSNIYLEAEDLTKSFRLRFDSRPNIDRITFGDFEIVYLHQQ